MASTTLSRMAPHWSALGLRRKQNIHYQLSPEELVEQSLCRSQGQLTDSGALLIQTGEFTGRSPRDKFIVRDPLTADSIHWNEFNQPLDPDHFEVILSRMRSYLDRQPEVWLRDCLACADPRYRLRIRVINDRPWSNLFAYNMFLRPTAEELEDFIPDWTVWHAAGLRLDPEACGIRQGNAAVISLRHRMILIAGTGYTGEIKKGVFTILNYLLPRHHQVLPMHCSANLGTEGDTALFFGLSGTGKTTLSADPCRRLIGDDEHGWSEDRIFNFEGGCYAKTIQLSPEKEPAIFQAIRPGALLENACFFPGTHRIDFHDASRTENTRVSYPLHYIANALEPAAGPGPRNLFFLTCDAFGVLPPIARLSPAQAMYQFISGYTAKVAGTETGVTEPKPTFSACFGAPFLPLHPGVYAGMLGEKLRRNPVRVWLVNTGWTGGPYGTGRRMSLAHTRALIAAALSGQLDAVSYHPHPVFGVSIPSACPGVPAELLDPRQTWADPLAYDRQAACLAGLFARNFEKYRDGVDEEVREAGPRC